MEKSIIDKIDSVLERISCITSGVPAFATGILLVVWVILIPVYVFARLFLRGKWLFVPEFTAYWGVGIAFLSLAYALRSRSHITVDIVVRHLPKRVIFILEAITTFFSLVMTFYLMERSINWSLYAFTTNMHSLGPMHTLMWPIYILVPIGLLALGLGLLQYLYHHVVAAVGGERAALENLEKSGKS